MKTKEPIWIEEREILAIHDHALTLHGGGKGLRDRSLLQSALARPREHHAYSEHPDILEMAALYTAGIVRNHPFVDGNKRTGFIAGVLFLELNGFRFEASEEDAAQAVLDLAAGKIDHVTYAAFLRENARRNR